MKRKALASLALLAFRAWAMIIGAAVGIGVVVGLGGWAAIAIWSKFMSIQARQQARQEQAAIGLTISAPAEEAAQGFALAAVDVAPIKVAKDQVAAAAAAAAGELMAVSTNLVHWTVIPAAQMPGYFQDAPMGFWRPATPLQQ